MEQGDITRRAERWNKSGTMRDWEGVDKGEGVLATGGGEGGMKMVAVFKNSAGDGVKGREAFVTIRRTRSERCRRRSDSVT